MVTEKKGRKTDVVVVVTTLGAIFVNNQWAGFSRQVAVTSESAACKTHLLADLDKCFRLQHGLAIASYLQMKTWGL